MTRSGEFIVERGYVAQGFGYDRLLMIDNRWVDLSGQGAPSELIKEIVKTVRRR